MVDLMKAMDYGDGFVTKYSGDDGIDGIIHEDKLGFNLIYIPVSYTHLKEKLPSISKKVPWRAVMPTRSMSGVRMHFWQVVTR